MRNNSADSVKFFGSLAVTLMHVANYLPTVGRATYLNYYWYFPILDLAVPLFFAMAGFFIAFKDLEYYPVYFKRLFTIHVAYTCFYFLIYWPLDIMSQWSLGNRGLSTFTNYFAHLTLTDFLTGIAGSDHLWFLMALFFATIIFYLLKSLKLTLIQILCFSTILYLLTFTWPLNLLTDNLLLYGGFVKALFYFTCGVWLAKLKLSIPYSGLSIIGSIILLIVGDTFTDSLLFREFLLATVTVAILIYISNNLGRESFISRLGKHSLTIYLLHYLFVGAFNVLASFLPILLDVPDFIRIVVLTIVAIGGSILLYPVTTYLFYQPINKLLTKVF